MVKIEQYLGEVMTHSSRIVSLVSVLAAVLLLAISVNSAASAQSPQPMVSESKKESMVERHKKMSEMHSKMAACLESDRPAKECRKEMRETCSAAGGGECSMMGKKGKGMRNKGGSCEGMMDSDLGSETESASPTK
jgi:hypothetical protein